MLMLDWNHKLKADGVKVWGVGPGFLATGLGNVQEKEGTASRTARKITGSSLFPQGGMAATPAVLTTASQLASEMALLIEAGSVASP